MLHINIAESFAGGQDDSHMTRVLTARGIRCLHTHASLEILHTRQLDEPRRAAGWDETVRNDLGKRDPHPPAQRDRHR